MRGGLSLAHAMQVVPVHAGLLIAVHYILRCLPLRRPYPAGCTHRQCGLCLPPQQHARAPSAAPAATVRGATCMQPQRMQMNPSKLLSPSVAVKDFCLDLSATVSR